MVRNQLIDVQQVAMMLALFRVFDLLTFVPQSGKEQNAATFLLALPFSYLLLGMALIPAGLLFRRSPGDSYIDCALRQNRLVGKLLAALLLFYALGIAADTMSNFEFLLTTALYPETSPLFFILSFSAVCAYAAYMGLEPMARVNTFLFFIFIATALFISLAVWPQAEWVYLRNPFEEGASSFFQQVVSGCFANFDVVLWLLLVRDIKGNVKKGFLAWGIITVLLNGYLTLLLTVGLGDYAKTQIFPFYSLAAFSEVSIFQRLDSLHIVLWTFIAFIKTSLYLYLASRCAKYFLPSGMRKTAVGTTTILAAGAAWVISLRVDFLHGIQQFLQSGIPVLLYVIVLPSLLLVWLVLRRRRREAR